MAIGLPDLDIQFKKLAVTAVQRSAKGIVALIVKDATDNTYAVKEYQSALAIETAKFTATNAKYIQQIFDGGAARVIVVPINPTSSSVVPDAIAAIGSRKYNWIGLAEGAVADQTALVTYLKSPEAKKKSIKGVVFNATSPDSERVVNFTNTHVTYVGGTKVTGEKYIARLLGVLAGLPLTRSSTYYNFPDLIGVTEPADVNAAVEAGKFVLFNDNDTIRVARGVNSLVTLSPTVSEEQKKIIITETMDTIRNDVTGLWKDFIGKWKNSYDNQVLLNTAINVYFEQLELEDVLDEEYDNKAYVDVNAQRLAWQAIGKTEAADWDDDTARVKTLGSKVFLAASIKLLDAMEDLQFNIELQ
ncbi:KR domain-containing protein [Paenibacillaceae bacterium GAS479]|nr:KR domain-containing protein [Paenibacillaceae bacterium GAS479]